MSPKQIIAILVLVAGVGFRVVMSTGGDDAPAPPVDPAAATPAPAAPGQAASTQPVSQVTPTPAAAPSASPAPKKRVRQSANFPRRFEKRVVKVCGRYENLVEKAIADTDEDTVERMRKVVRAIEDMATDFEEMSPPARNERAWNRYTGFYQDASDLFGRIESEVADEDKPAFDRYVAKSRKIVPQEKRLNRRFGFAACVND